MNINKLSKIGTEVKRGNNHQINFKNLQRFVDYKLSKKSDANFIYFVKRDSWLGDSSFNETEKAEMIQAILNYEPSANEIKEIPLEIVPQLVKKCQMKMSDEDIRCAKFDCETATDRYYQGF